MHGQLMFPFYLRQAYWLPSKTPEAQAQLEKPSGDVMCPNTGKKLRIKVCLAHFRLPSVSFIWARHSPYCPEHDVE
jgi:hypothetical protein